MARKAKAAEAQKTGRPSDYTPEITATICERLADGESLRSICSAAAMPDKATVFRWLAKHEDFRDHYAHARDAQADRLFEECLDIADDASADYMEKQLGDDGPAVSVVDHEHISRSKLRVDTRKWMAGKLAPKKYGDRVALVGDADNPIAVKQVHDFSDDELTAIAAGGGARAVAKKKG